MPHTILAERLARAEGTIEDLEKQVHKIDDSLGKLLNEVHNIRIRLEKSISFVGGVSFAFSMLGAALGATIIFILKKLGVEI